MDTQRLEKFFRLLGSDNEHEAAAALRKIKSLIKDAGLTWNQFVGQISFGSSKQETYKQTARKNSVKDFEEIFRQARAAAEEAEAKKREGEKHSRQTWDEYFRADREARERERRNYEDWARRNTKSKKEYEDYVSRQRGRAANWDFERNKYWFEDKADDWIKNTTKENEESLHKETTAEQKEEAWNTFFKRA